MKLRLLWEDLEEELDDAGEGELTSDENSITPEVDYDLELVDRVGVSSMNPVGRTYKKGLGKQAREIGPKMSTQGVSR